MATTLLFVSALILGCSEQPLPTASGDAPITGPALNFTNGPASPGPYLIRFEDNSFAFFFLEGKTGRQIAVGNDLRLVCTPPFGNPSEFVQIQHTMPPDDMERVIELIHAEGLLGQVWDFPVFDCGLYLTETPLVEGLVDLTGHNRSEFLFGDEPNASGFNVNGAFNAHLRCHANENQAKCNAKIVIP